MQQMILNTVLRALAAVVIGGLIGSERARHGRAAGMRTHILVCLGACMTSMTSMFVSDVLGNNGDVFRIPAQVVSGIGFLGAGMILPPPRLTAAKPQLYYSYCTSHSYNIFACAAPFTVRQNTRQLFKRLCFVNH